MKKVDTTFPTVATESLFITSTIDAFEGKKVATMDVSSASMSTTMDPKYSKVYMALQRQLSELMVKVDPNLYRKSFSTDNKGSMILYVEMQKAFYGIFKSVLLFYL